MIKLIGTAVRNMKMEKMNEGRPYSYNISGKEASDIIAHIDIGELKKAVKENKILESQCKTESLDVIRTKNQESHKMSFEFNLYQSVEFIPLGDGIVGIKVNRDFKLFGVPSEIVWDDYYTIDLKEKVGENINEMDATIADELQVSDIEKKIVEIKEKSGFKEKLKTAAKAIISPANITKSDDGKNTNNGGR